MKTNKQIAAEATQAAAAEAASKEAEVIDMPRPAPQIIQLTPEERLETENVKLKRRLLQVEHDVALKKLGEMEQAIIARVGQRTGADLKRYAVDLESGTCQLMEQPK